MYRVEHIEKGTTFLILAMLVTVHDAAGESAEGTVSIPEGVWVCRPIWKF